MGSVEGKPRPFGRFAAVAIAMAALAALLIALPAFSYVGGESRSVPPSAGQVPGIPDALHVEPLGPVRVPDVERAVLAEEPGEWTLVARSSRAGDGELCLLLELSNGSGGFCGAPAKMEALTYAAVSPDPDRPEGFLVGLSRGSAKSFEIGYETGGVSRASAIVLDEFPGLAFFVTDSSAPMTEIVALDSDGAEVARARGEVVVPSE